MKSFALASLIGATAFAARETCQVQKTGIENFDVKSYTGTWYEIARTKGVPFQSGDCDQAQYTFDVDHIKVANSEEIDGKRTVQEGTAYCAQDGTANCEVSFFWWQQDKPSDDEHNYDVIETDYEKFTIVHSCSEYFWGLYTFELLWILARDPNPTESEIESWMEKTQAYGFDVSQLQRTYQGAKCHYI